MSALALHLLSDPYPQNRDWGIAPMAERVLGRLQSWVWLSLTDTRWHASRFVAKVRSRLAEIQLLNDEKALDRWAQSRLMSRKHGLDHFDHVAECFAWTCLKSKQTLGIEPFDTQIRAAYSLIRQRAVELDTGEGKTLTAALAAIAAAQAGLRVHVITANDYLAQRDALELAPLYRAMGFEVNSVLEETPIQMRPALYQSPVVYCSNKTITFDYLRDRVIFAERLEPLRLGFDKWLGRGAPSNLPGLVFAILDEVDSVLVDEARTPLVLSRTIEDPEHKIYVRQAVVMARSLEHGRDFIMHPVSRRPVLTEAGAKGLPELVAQLEEPSIIWLSVWRTEEALTQALYALYGLVCDVDYVVRDNKVMIVDENTGRTMADRSWEMGLHQMVEVKEGLEMTGSRETMARISYQLFFRRYLGLCGMSGTCRELSSEFFDIYGMPSLRVPPRNTSRRRALGTRLYRSSPERWQACLSAVKREVARQRPVLVGTKTVRESEILSNLLSQNGIDHQVLNAKQDEGEALAIASAGASGKVMIATNMAGRGTDIKLSNEARQAGGLHVIITEMHDNARVQRQLIGRCARQGDPGSWEAIFSADDAFFVQQGEGWSRLLSILAVGRSWRGLRHGLAMLVVKRLQASVERQHRRTRMHLLESDLDRRNAMGFTGISE
jgi:preprotein translocase subunit SecA